MTDYGAQLRRVTIGEPSRIDGPIHLAGYDREWPRAYESQAARIREALGEGMLGAGALAIEHVGSTSVPGLAAKPRIDILLVVPNSADEPAYVPALEQAGYTLHIREPDWHQHRLFHAPDIEANVHVFTAGCSEIERMVRFRDWLREHPADRDLYLARKRALAARRWEYVQQYADAKGELVEAILARAGAPPPNPQEHQGP